jgi:hypothetical protein
MPALWDDTLAIPAAIRATLGARDGFDEVVAALRGATRVVMSGNGAAWYVAHGAWLASLEGTQATPAHLIALPAGQLTPGRFEWRDGDVLLCRVGERRAARPHRGARGAGPRAAA